MNIPPRQGTDRILKTPIQDGLMTVNDIHHNTFESLSLLASQEQWCWKLNCTTCGHMVFRWGLKAIAKGLHPNDSNWPVHWSKGTASGDLEKTNGPMPPPRGWPSAEQLAIQDATRGYKLTNIVGVVPFPDWLGHLGILLRYAEDAERDNLVLTRELVPQLLTFVETASSAELMLRQCMEHLQPLQPNDLELVERCCHIR